jgi:hypothetical protein
MTVIISSEKPKRSRYRTYGGVGSVVPIIANANANAVAAKAARRPSIGTASGHLRFLTAASGSLRLAGKRRRTFAVAERDS